MEFRDTPEEAAFRSEVRSFINTKLPSTLKNVSAFEEPDDAEQMAALRDWRTAVGQKGWTAPHWPKEYGGAGMTVTEQFVYSEEMATARAPQVGGSGVSMLGPVLIRYGTEEQQKEHLPRITSGEVQWCQGYSEPGSGSDLASLQTRAIRDGDDYVINGQKIWTSGAHRADWMFLLARTDPNAPKHRGISMLLMDMKSPGVTVQPLITMGGDHIFNQEFFDDVRVPAKNIVGEENRGWYVGAALLDFERSNIAGAIGHAHFVNDIVALAKSASAGSALSHRLKRVRNELADRALEAEIARLISYRLITIQKRGGVPNYEASMNKNFGAELGQRIATTGMHLLGMMGGLNHASAKALMKGRINHAYLTTVASTIAAGTSEVNRNVIATRGLGLPRS
ncbi:MAG: acyl-CoA dehydrogenase family protein [Tepidiformaceae bacterium]